MKIIFNGLNSGLGNNGGSRTILLSQKVLKQLGHKCVVVSTKDEFTWFDHDGVVDYIPRNADAVINIAAVDYKSTLNMPVEKKFAWWRAHESWSMPESTLMELYRDKRIKNIVNSKGLQRKLKEEAHADSVVVYQGIDFDLWENRQLRPKDKIRIGALHTKQPRKRWKDFVKLAKILGTDKYEYVGMGSAAPKNAGFLTDFKENANVEELNNLYSSCHIWVATTVSEGLHNVPMEASLCGCLVVCAREPLNGMMYDYAFDGKTAMIYDKKDIQQAAELIKDPDWSLIPNMQDHLRSEIGTREENMHRMLTYLEDL